MIREPVTQAEAREPADRQVHLGFPHQAAVMDDPEQEARRRPASEA